MQFCRCFTQAQCACGNETDTLIQASQAGSKSTTGCHLNWKQADRTTKVLPRPRSVETGQIVGDPASGASPVSGQIHVRHLAPELTGIPDAWCNGKVGESAISASWLARLPVFLTCYFAKLIFAQICAIAALHRFPHFRNSALPHGVQRLGRTALSGIRLFHGGSQITADRAGSLSAISTQNVLLPRGSSTSSAPLVGGLGHGWCAVNQRRPQLQSSSKGVAALRYGNARV